MREQLAERLEAGRVRSGRLGSDPSYGATGAFDIQGPCGEQLNIIANAANEYSEGWEHVSVSIQRRRPPNWQEMCFVKELFWGDDEWVVQFHPPKSEYVNNHSRCLHLWRHKDFPTPPAELVGVKEIGTLT
jgi:hypothetical protein